MQQKRKFIVLLMLLVSKLFAQEKELGEQPPLSQSSPEFQEKTQKISFFNSQKFIFKEKRIFSLDAAYLWSGLKNDGWGLGLSYEQAVLPFLSAKGEFSHMTLWPAKYDVVITTVGVSMSTFYYPFNKGLNFLYVGFGCKTDFLMYSGGDVLREKRKDSLIYIFPSIGWKQNLYDYVLIDIFYGYRFSIFDEDLPAFASEMTGKGGEAGIKVKLNLQKILKRLFGKQS